MSRCAHTANEERLRTAKTSVHKARPGYVAAPTCFIRIARIAAATLSEMKTRRGDAASNHDIPTESAIRAGAREEDSGVRQVIGMSEERRPGWHGRAVGTPRRTARQQVGAPAVAALVLMKSERGRKRRVCSGEMSEPPATVAVVAAYRTACPPFAVLPAHVFSPLRPLPCLFTSAAVTLRYAITLDDADDDTLMALRCRQRLFSLLMPPPLIHCHETCCRCHAIISLLY